MHACVREVVHLSDTARDWIVANTIPTVFAAIASPIVFLIGKAMGVPGVDTTFAAQAVYVALLTAVLAICLLLFARMTGRVLATQIPAFPHSRWVAMHLTVGLVVGFVTALAMLNDVDSEPMDWSDKSAVVTLLLVMLVGSAVGAVIGAFQALVLRSVANGLGFWIASWAIAFGLLLPFGGGAEMLVDGARSLKHELVAAGATIVIGFVGAIVLLPAVRRLRSKI